MKKILVINGVNLNMLGIRERSLYGEQTYAQLEGLVYITAKKLEIDVEVWQSNSESAIVDKIQQAYGVVDGIVINAGAYTHTSIAILDALKAVSIPVVEVHLTDIHSREDFRNFSYIALVAQKQICGKGIDGYADALEYFVRQ